MGIRGTNGGRGGGTERRGSEQFRGIDGGSD